MRRRLLIAVIFLLAGAVVNVAVAWLCAATIRPGTTPALWWERARAPCDFDLWVTPFRQAGVARYCCSLQPHSSATPKANVEMDIPPWVVHVARHYARKPAGLDPSVYFRNKIKHDIDLVIDCRGWPLPALYSQLDRWHATLAFGIPIRDVESAGTLDRTEPFALPLRPLWPGFAINTLFYAAILWLLACGPFALRRFLRIRRGLCPACAYPMGRGPMCTECGRVLPAARKPAT